MRCFRLMLTFKSPTQLQHVALQATGGRACVTISAASCCPIFSWLETTCGTSSMTGGKPLLQSSRAMTLNTCTKRLAVQL
jgi:hypothetical protein